jgi:outer membrane protein assembly factor BamE (lipoprotein component of BamABCDE complex)
MKRRYAIFAISVSLALMTGCMSASEHASKVQEGLQGDRLTVGTVQREIRIGMSGAEVAQVLGSPNIVTTDEEGGVWIRQNSNG